MMRAEILDTTKKIQAATPQARRRTVIFLAIVTVTGVALVIGVEQWLGRVRDLAVHDHNAASDQIAYVIRVLAAAISLSLVGLALVLTRVSWRVYAARRFPPPGMSLAFDVQVVEGLRAVWRAFWGFFFSTILGALAVVMPYLLWRILMVVMPAHAG